MAHSPDYINIYVTTTAFCEILVVIMTLQMNTNIGAALEIKTFRRIAFSFMIANASESIWVAGTAIPSFPIWLNYSVNLADLVATGQIVWYWYVFADLKLTPKAKLKRRPRMVNLVNAVPILVLVCADTLSVWNHAVFYVTDRGVYMRGSWYWIQVACCYLYYGIVICRLIRSRIRKTLDPEDFRVYILFTAIPFIGGVLQVVLNGKAPYTVMAMTVGVFVMFNYLQGQQINTDALTGLSNRRRAGKYLTARLARADKDPVVLFMADIDYFKQINDRYGHLAGDEALCIVADTARVLAKSYRTFFAARYGGDEFTFFISKSEADPDSVMSRFAGELERQVQKSELEYTFSVSLGYAVADREDLTVKELVRKADESLYIHKTEEHERNRYKGQNHFAHLRG